MTNNTLATGYHKTPEAEKSWSDKVNLRYENTPDDSAYKRFLEITKNCPKEKRKREILSLTRKVVGSSAKEFIIWNEREVAYDGIGNEMHFFRGSMGLVPQPVPIMQLRQIPGTLETESYVAGIREIHTGYSMPFTQKNADMFYKDCVGSTDDDLDRVPTQFSIEVGNMRTTVDSFELWRNGSIEQLKGKPLLPPPPQQQQPSQPKI